MADVEFNGSQGIIPDFALESTQENILAALQKQYKLSDKDLKNAKSIFNNDNKNTKSTIDALKKMGDDITDAIDNKNGVFSSLSAAGGGLASLGGYAVAAGAALVGMTAGIAKVTLSLAKGFGDDLKKAGLSETGAAFGELGAELNVLVPGLMTFGLSVSEAGSAIQNFRTSMTMVSGSAIKDVIGTFQQITNGGAKYGRTISENIEFLSDEIEYRARLGFIDQANSKRAAQDAQEIMDSQINASKLLGKSVDEIANGVKDLFTGDIDIMASLATLGPDIEMELRKTFQTFEGAGLPKEFQAGLAKMLTDPIMLGSEEAKNAFNALSVLPDDMGDSVRRDVENLRAAMDLPEGTEGRQAAIEKANKKLEYSMLEMGNNINNLNKNEKEALFIQGQSIPFLKDLLASQRGFAAAYENFGKETDLNKSLANSVLFDNQITMLTNSFNVLLSSVKSGMAPALEMFTDALGSMTDKDSPISKFRVRLEDISGKIIDKFNGIFGMGTDLNENTNIVSGLLGTLGDMVESVADSFLTFFESLNDTSGDTFMAKVGNFVSDMIGSLLDIIGEQVRQIDIMDVLFGESEKEITDDAAKRVESSKSRRRGNQSEEQKSEGLMRAMSDIIDYRDEKNEKKPGSVDAEKMLEMVTKAGVDIQELTGKNLLQLFPDAGELRDAITSTYGEGATEAFANVTGKIIEHTKAQQTELKDGFRSNFRREDHTNDLVNEQKAIQSSFLDALLPEIEVTAKKRSVIIDDTTSPKEKPPEPEITNAEKSAKAQMASDADKKVKIIKADTDKLEKLIDKNSNINASESAQPDQPLPNSIMVDPESAEPTTSTTGPSSQDGTKTQAVKAEPIGGDSSSNYVKELTEAIIIAIGPKLDLIATNTKKTASGIASLPDNIN